MNEITDVLLIEDSTTQALQLRLLLQRVGYHVRIATDGAEGWRLACSSNPRLILLDVNLPLLDGFQVLTRLKRGRNTATIPIVMLTSRDSVADVERAIALGADDYLFKDDCLSTRGEPALLYNAVDQVLRPKN
jgi:DNA-binding response OmpR family regulator